MSNVAVIDQSASPRRSVTADMASRFGMDTAAFEQTLRATVFPNTGTREQFAAFLLVAKQYDLNPITKELYAFPAKGGGIVPIVSIDGWLKLINSHPQFDGMEFADNHDDKGELISVTCKLWRKDRSKPIVVTEYLAECFRSTEPWKMKHRMLRHKALIQTARYAFGFAGIYDPDEGERIAEAQSRRDHAPGPAPVITSGRQLPPPPPPAPVEQIAPPTGKKAPPGPPPPPVASDPNSGAFDFDGLRKALREAQTEDAANDVFDRLVTQRSRHMTDDELTECDNIAREAYAAFVPAPED